MLTAVAHDLRFLMLSLESQRIVQNFLFFVLLCNKSLNDWSLGEQSLSVKYQSSYYNCYTAVVSFSLVSFLYVKYQSIYCYVQIEISIHP